MAKWNTEAGCDILCDLHEARNLLAEAIRKSRENAIPCSSALCAAHELDEAIEVMARNLSRAGVQ